MKIDVVDVLCDTCNFVILQSAVSETVGVEVVLKNPLKIPLNLTDLLLLWKFKPEDNADSISNEVR